jgi:hypothetical protein
MLSAHMTAKSGHVAHKGMADIPTSVPIVDGDSRRGARHFPKLAINRIDDMLAPTSWKTLGQYVGGLQAQQGRGSRGRQTSGDASSGMFETPDAPSSLERHP